MTKIKILDKILLEIYQELFNKATPSADFNKLVKESDWITVSELTGCVNIHHQTDEMTDEECRKIGWKKDIIFQNYRILKDVQRKIVDKILNKYKKLTDNDRKIILYNLSVGCQPIIVNNEEDLTPNEEESKK